MNIMNDYGILSQSLLGYSLYQYRFNSSYQKIKLTKLLLNYYPHLKLKFKYAIGYCMLLYIQKIHQEFFNQKNMIKNTYRNQKIQMKNSLSNISYSIYGKRVNIELVLSIYCQRWKLNIINYFYMKKFKYMLLYNIYIQKIILCYYSILNTFNLY